MEIAAQNNFGVENGPSRNFLLERHLVECEKNAELLFLNRSLRKQVCSQNCASGVIHWICENKLGWDSLCSIQIERICFVEAGKKENVETVVECKRMWQIYEECGVLDLLDHYAFPDETNAKLEVINKAWNKIMTSNEEVLVLGKTNPKADGGGHLVVCDLKTKTKNGYEICDPQIDKSEFVSRETFTAEIVSVDSIENLIVFKVNLKKLEQIIDEHRDVLHFSDHNRSTMQPEPLAITSVVESVQNSRIVNRKKVLAVCSPVILKTILSILTLILSLTHVCFAVLVPPHKKCRKPLDCKREIVVDHMVLYCLFLLVSIFSRVKFVVVFFDGAACGVKMVGTIVPVMVLIEILIRNEFGVVCGYFLFSERLRVLTSILVVFLAVIVVIAVVVPSVHVAKIVFIVFFAVIVVVFIIAYFVPSVWPIAVGIAGAVAFVFIVVTIVPVSHFFFFCFFLFLLCV